MLSKGYLLALGITGLTGYVNGQSYNYTQNVTQQYSGPLRPQVHFSPPQDKSSTPSSSKARVSNGERDLADRIRFMNDPNGMFRSPDGTWHLYFQYNPTPPPIAGNQHWGHATSKDLYNWTNQPIALSPPNTTSGIFSGSAVLDPNNTSGFFGNISNGTVGVVAIYTLNTPYQQSQNLAYSTDGGYNFTYYTNNPILSIGSTQFRDPKVIRYNNNWIMIIAYSVDFTIGIYTSPDLKNWTFGSNFTHYGLLGLQFECPNLVNVPYQDGSGSGWVMYISINPGAPLGGSIGQYFIGSFNGTHFIPDDNVARIADWGKDNYASQWFYGTGNDAISIGWASNWQYTNVVPTGQEGWRSAMTLPRRNFITNATRIGRVLGSQIYNINPILSQQLNSTGNLINSSINVDYSQIYTGSIYFQINLTYPSTLPTFGSYASVNFTFSSSASGENITGGYYLGGDNAGQAFLNRGNIRGFDNPFFNDKFSIAQAGPPYVSMIEGVVDRSIIEVFLNKGANSATSVFYPTKNLDTMSIGSIGIPGGVGISVAVWSLKSSWGG